ncbi:glycine betaine ABC transporter substrate-binding protein [Pseudonocardia xinjiangensis]|uniref:Glycine/betaine ABC transporter substrate-binding protein n=1 Tax=Pseudonocardia xinjiangensis TaxID=75289 RepID=A0ABX1RC94_9PSEU|nr:glycine betaine ABC transporter substrate-binding protein [Pseudonocardia xinjiangensis]NMH77044.1 glycine/betaine ABC transporter substrate-binding protein [Pseudonocardia xinjiangensis]
MTSRATSRSHRVLGALALVGALALTACSSGSGGAGGGDTGDSVAARVHLAGTQIAVGSKEFTEQLILGQITVQALRAAGATVEDRTALVGTPVVRGALLSDQIDMYWEYTGTAWLGPLGNTDPVAGEQAQFDAVKNADAANGITWLAMAGANNAYALAANPDAAREFGVATISDYARLAQQNPTAATLCTAAEFPTRNDGLPAVEKTYGFDLPDADVAVLDFGLVYTSVAAREPCNFAVVFGTDAQVLQNKLVVLKDDKQALATYNVAVSMRTQTYAANPDAYNTLFGAIAAALTTERATQLNAKVDIDGETPEDVAKEFLVENRIITG